MNGSYVALSKPLVAALPVFLLAWLRFGLAAVVMGTWLRKPDDEPPLTQRTRWLLFLESFVGNFLFSICILYGMRWTTASAAGVVMSSMPAVVAVLSALFLRERLPGRTLAAIVLAAIGIALFSMDKSGASHTSDGNFHGVPLPLLGNLLVFAAVICEAVYVVIGKHLTQGLGPRRIAAIINIWGLVLSTPAGLWGAWYVGFGQMHPVTWALLVYYALAASVWTVWLWMTGLRHVPANMAGVFSVLMPLTAAAVGTLFLGEHLTPGQTVAFAIALAGLLLATLPGRRSAPTPQPQATNDPNLW